VNKKLMGKISTKRIMTGADVGEIKGKSLFKAKQEKRGKGVIRSRED